MQGCRPGLQYFGKLDPDPHKSEKLDPYPDPHYSYNSGVLEEQVGAYRGLNTIGRRFTTLVGAGSGSGSEMHPDLHFSDADADPDPA